MTRTADLLLEIGMEEMPARFVRGGMDQLKEKITAWLENNRISFGEVKAMATPRRLALTVSQVSAEQSAKSEWVKGPALKAAKTADGGWSNAALGFARSQGVQPEQFEIKPLNGVDYLYVLKEEAGRETASLLAEVLPALISGMTFPKNMRWARHEMRFLRPIRWLVALFGGEVIPFRITNVDSGRQSYGHRFLGGLFEIKDAASYVEQMREQFVIADTDERQALIEAQLEVLEAKNGWTIPVDPDLLEEVLFLVEYPTALSGNFESTFLHIPKEVLMTSMREHQRYFPVLGQDGKLLPHFVTVRNGNSTSLEVVAKGNEKVLRARLSDAKFFYDEDQKKTIDSCLERLESIIQQEQLGTLGDKVRRMNVSSVTLAATLGEPVSVTQDLLRATHIAKFDLVTSMVYEFTELQGLMGEHYALLKGESPAVAQAVREQYMPKNAGDALPASRAGTLLSIVEKADNLLGCFYLNLIPTGSQDPYGLRRQAAGIVQMIAELDKPLLLSDVFEAAWTGFSGAAKSRELKLDEENYARCKQEWNQFFTLRLKTMLENRNIRYDVIDALLAKPADDIPWLIARAELLMSRLQADDTGLKRSVEAWQRACNLAAKAEDVTDLSVIPFSTAAEQRLAAQILESGKSLTASADARDAAAYLEQLNSWVEPINVFFDQTMVMVDDPVVRNQRLSLLHAAAKSVWTFADFSKLVWGGK